MLIGDKTIAEHVRMSVQGGHPVREAEVRAPGRDDRGADPQGDRERLGFLQNVGLGYLTLDRGAATLSGGEGQRIRLATQIGSRLTGVLYILDEPSIGLHQRDNRRLLDDADRHARPR